MSASSFPHQSNALTSPSASERGSPSLRFPLAPIVLSSQDDARTVVRVRYLSKALATVRFLPGTGGTFFRGILNLGGAYGLHSLFFRTLNHACKQLSGAFAFLFRQPSLGGVAHEQHTEWRALKCPTKVLKEPTK